MQRQVHTANVHVSIVVHCCWHARTFFTHDHTIADVTRKLEVLQQLKASFDVQPADASKAFTPTLVPALLSVLQVEPSDDGGHALRKGALELMGRIKPDEQLKPLAVDVLRTCLNVCMVLEAH